MKRLSRARLRKPPTEAWLPAACWLLTAALLAPAAVSASAESASRGAVAAESASRGAVAATTDAEPAPEPEASDQESEATADDAEEASFEERLDALLAEGAEAEVYGEKENCLYRRKYRNIDVVNEEILIFSRGNSYWINQLKRSCVGLRRSMVIHTLTHGVNSLCSNDMVYANRPIDLNQGFTSSGRPMMVRAQCVLGPFQSIPEPYAQALMGLNE